ncbi:hypothetical protein [Consotaella aegiceratis]|uniref:hypothetical protein n=1 Tax=Consotaella aegiceratis TaxID=3097961 RepID=UPI002F3FCC2D
MGRKMTASGWILAAGLAVAWIGPGKIAGPAADLATGSIPEGWSTWMPRSLMPSKSAAGRSVRSPVTASTPMQAASSRAVPTRIVNPPAPHLAQRIPAARGTGSPEQAKASAASKTASAPAGKLHTVPLPGSRPLMRQASGTPKSARTVEKRIATAEPQTPQRAGVPTPPGAVPLGTYTVGQRYAPTGGVASFYGALPTPPAPITGSIR